MPRIAKVVVEIAVEIQVRCHPNAGAGCHLDPAARNPSWVQPGQHDVLDHRFEAETGLLLRLGLHVFAREKAADVVEAPHGRGHHYAQDRDHDEELDQAETGDRQPPCSRHNGWTAPHAPLPLVLEVTCTLRVRPSRVHSTVTVNSRATVPMSVMVHRRV